MTIHPFAIFLEPAGKPVIALRMLVTGRSPVDVNEVTIYKKGYVETDVTLPHVFFLESDRCLPMKLIHRVFLAP